jgi:hypothetical protein
MVIFIAFLLVLFWWPMTEFVLGFAQLLPEHAAKQLLIWYWTLGFAVLGIALYALRTRLRLLYGLIEVSIASVFIAVATNSYIQASDVDQMASPKIAPKTVLEIDDFLGWKQTSVAWLSIAAAMYIFVRGMDNVGEGLGEFGFEQLQNRWRRVFPRRNELGFAPWQWVRRVGRSGPIYDEQGRLTPIPLVRVGPSKEEEPSDTESR